MYCTCTCTVQYCTRVYSYSLRTVVLRTRVLSSTHTVVLGHEGNGAIAGLFTIFCMSFTSRDFVTFVTLRGRGAE
jgi:hypothetical protein